MPSLLSAIDKGKAMVDIMNECGIQYVCIGNHESNVSLSSLLRRYDESKFVWINTNMPDLPMHGRPAMPDYIILKIPGHNCVKKIALLGLNTNEAKLYSPKAFGGAKILSPFETARKYAELLRPEVDCIIPLTHLSMPDDRRLAAMQLGFPIAVGGHDHDLCHEIVCGQHILKMGQDAINIGIVDLTWRGNEPEPFITVQVHESRAYDPHPAIVERIEVHMHVLDRLAEASLTPFPVGVPMSSAEVRKQTATMGVFLCTAAREALSAECCIYKAGYLRGCRDYDDQVYFTYADLVAEVGLDRVMVVIPVPGSVIADTARFGRTGDRVNTGEFLQFDNQMAFNESTSSLERIAGEPVDPDRMYDLAIPFKAIGSIEPLTVWAKANPDLVPDNEQAGVTMPVLLVNYWSATVWLQLGRLLQAAGPKGPITQADVRGALRDLYPAAVCDIMVDNIMAVADTNGDGTISVEELMECALKCAQWSLLDADHDGEISRRDFSGALDTILQCPSALSPEQRHRLFDEIDGNGDGLISRAELRGWVSRHRTQAIGIVDDGPEDFRPPTEALEQRWKRRLTLW